MGTTQLRVLLLLFMTTTMIVAVVVASRGDKCLVDVLVGGILLLLEQKQLAAEL